MSDNCPQNPTQLSKALPGLHQHWTGHSSEGKAIIASSHDAQWSHLRENTMAFSVVYTTSRFPPELSNDADITAHQDLMKGGGPGLVRKNGTVCRIVDFGPGNSSEPLMHRTQSLDYGCVLEGEIEMILDSGEKTMMKRGDVAVQRGTNHAWRNVSETDWARMLFVLQESEEIVVAGKVLGEELHDAGHDAEELSAK